jgi:hypothetical protein
MMGMLKMITTLPFSKLESRARGQRQVKSFKLMTFIAGPRAGMKISQSHHFKCQKVTIYERVP